MLTLNYFCTARQDLSLGCYSQLDDIKSVLDYIKDNTTEEVRQFRNQVEHEFSSLKEDLNQLKQQLMSDQGGACATGQYTCGGTEGWRRVVYLDMTDPSTTCPSGWSLTDYSKRTCGRLSTSGQSCDSATFPVSGGEYSKVCGRIKAYQYGATLGLYLWKTAPSTIDGAYVSGFSLTHGNPREHIWTFAAGISEQQYGIGVSTCPCGTDNFEHWHNQIPSFVGNDYFCESGLNGVWPAGGYVLFPDDPLWDGENCPSGTCCSFSNPPFFTKTLNSPTSDSLEVRLCNYHTSVYSDVPVELIELYVQ